MVHEVGTDAGQLVTHGNPQRFEAFPRANAGEHEQLRRPDGAGRQHHLLSGHHGVGRSPVPVGQSFAPAGFQVEPLNQAARADRQVATRDRRREVSHSRAAANPVPHRHLQVTKAFLAVAVEVVAEPMPGLLGCLEKNLV